MDKIQMFQRALEKACKARDSSASVQVFETFTTPVTGEYVAVVLYSGGKEVYAFNPSSGNWIICYEVR